MMSTRAKVKQAAGSAVEKRVLPPSPPSVNSISGIIKKRKAPKATSKKKGKASHSNGSPPLKRQQPSLTTEQKNAKNETTPSTTDPNCHNDKTTTPSSAADDEVDSKQKEERSYFLVKSEPETRMQDGHDMKFSIDDLAEEPNATTHWDGVRNYEARNIMRKMRTGDRAFFYHSNSRQSRPAIVGEVEIVREAYPDHTAFDKEDPHYDPKSSPGNPKWFMVDVRLLRKFAKPVSLDDIKACDKLAAMQLVKRGRISVQYVTADEWGVILSMAGEHPLE